MKSLAAIKEMLKDFLQRTEPHSTNGIQTYNNSMRTGVTINMRKNKIARQHIGLLIDHIRRNEPYLHYVYV